LPASAVFSERRPCVREQIPALSFSRFPFRHP
jgi:hypothetical protein